MISSNRNCIKILMTIIFLLTVGYMVDSYGCEEGTDMKKYYICEGGFCKR